MFKCAKQRNLLFSFPEMHFITVSQLLLKVEVNAAHLSPLESMATAENVDREKHHFNPAENHYYSFNNRKTIQRDYLGSEFATPPYSPPESFFMESELAQCSARRYETTLPITLCIFRNTVNLQESCSR